MKNLCPECYHEFSERTPAIVLRNSEGEPLMRDRMEELPAQTVWKCMPVCKECADRLNIRYAVYFKKAVRQK